MKKLFAGLFMFAALVTLSTPGIFGQVGSAGAVVGVIKDSTGAVVPGAEVTITNLGTGHKSTLASDDAGSFEVVQLPNGFYSISVTLPGFKTWTLERTQLVVGERKRLYPVLEIGEVSEQITVQAGAELVQTEKGSVEALVEEKAIRELPLNGRNPLSLINLVPGMRYLGIGGIHRQQAVQGLGNRDDQNEFQLDGISTIEHSDKRATGLPSIETIAEFNVQTANFSAENGSAPLQILMVSKTGTNELHGSVFQFHRNDALDARNTFATSKPKLIRNQFGGALGGPIIKNRTFFFGSFEGTKVRQERIYNSVVVDPRMLQGDFSFLSKTIRDPLTGKDFPGNKIPENRFSPAAKFFFPWILLPNSPDGRFRAVAPRPDDLSVYSIRLDHQITDDQKLFGRWIINDQNVIAPDSRPSIVQTIDTLQHNVAMNYNWSITPTTLFTVGAGYLRTFAFATSNGAKVGEQNLTQDAGIKGFQTEGRGAHIGLPSVSFAGYTGFNAPWGVPNRQKIWAQNAKANMNLIRGHHSVSFGYQYLEGRSAVTHGSCCSRGVFGFNGQYTGDGFADYLLGYNSTALRNFPLAVIGVSDSPYSGLYVQDFWRVHPNITLNLGARVDYWHEKAFARGTGSTFLLDRGVSVAGENAKTGQVDLTAQPVSRFLAAATEGLWIPASEAGLPPGLFVPRGALSPRLGVAWRPSGGNDLVFRAGYGIYPSIYRDNITGSSIIGPPYWTFESQAWSRTQLQRWETAFPDDPSSFVAPSVVAARPETEEMKSHQWNFSVQKLLPFESALTVSYVGNRGVDLMTQFEFNSVPAGEYQNLQAAKPYPAFGSVGLYDNIGESWYNSLQLKLERRFTHGLSYQFSYAFSKQVEEGGASIWDNPTPFAPAGYNRGRSENDRTHMLAINTVWEVPVGRGETWGSDLHPVANAILGGWQFSAIYVFNSGSPLSFAVPGATLGNGFGTRPNQVADPKLDNPTADRWFNTQAFAAPPRLQFGNSGIGIIDGPGLHLLDTALSKNFHLSEDRYVQFRWEMFNAPNHVNLAAPGTTLGFASYGRIFSAQDARSMQMGLKFVF